MKKRPYLFFYLGIVFLLVACAPTKSWKSEPSMKKVSNEFFDASITPIYRFNGYKGFVIGILNKTSGNIEVDWSNSFYLHAGNKDGGFWFEGLQQDSQKKIMPTGILTREMLTLEIYPANLRVLSQMAAAYVNENMMAGENGIYLTVNVMGKMASETMTIVLSEK